MDQSRPAPLRQLHEIVNYSLCMGHGFEWPAVRERVATLDLDAAARDDLDRLDRDALDHVLGAAADELFVPSAVAAPLAYWWRHADQLQAGTYPADLLPAPLRAIYLDHTKT
jgi:hypothetical protein